ncbi:MAG: hypothetical protein V4519_04275 [Patescibacteria group bacterium]
MFSTPQKYLKKIPAELWYILKLFIFSRIILSVLGFIAVKTLTIPEAAWRSEYTSNALLKIWAVWDSKWYLDIAQHGYSAVLPFNSYLESNYAFFPLYSLCIKLVSFLTQNIFIAGLVVSNVCFIAAAWVFYKLIKLDYSEQVTKRSLKYLFLLPAAFVFSGIFAESLFLLLALLCFYNARKNKWLWVGIFGILLGLTKPFAILIIPALIIIYGKQIKLSALALFSPLIGIVLYGFYTLKEVGDFFAYSHLQQHSWGHSYSDPLTTAFVALIKGNIHDKISLLFVALAIALCVFSYKKIKLEYFVFTVLLLLFNPLTGTFAGSLRYMIVGFPLALMLAVSSEELEKHEFLAIALALLQGGLMILWVHSIWLLV